MSQATMKAVLEKIKEYDKVVIFRHLRPDGDAVGATKGLREILRLSFPEKQVYLNNTDFSEYIGFLGDEDAPLSDDFYRQALGIVVDTAVVDRISNPRYALCRELVKIDHHIDVESYADLEWVEEGRSSASEMIAAFYRTFRDELKINREAATYIYTGMVTDSGRFRFRSVSGETMRLAGMLLDLGVDAEHLYANLYMRDFSSLKFQAHAFEQMQITENGVAYLHVTREMQERFSLSLEDASASVSYMENIRGSLIWLAFIDAPDGEIRVRLRSRFLPINRLAAKYHGGGHDCASGATVEDEKEMMALVADADALLAEYKRTHEGWL